MDLIRISTSIGLTLSHTFTDATGVPVEATGDVTATLKRLDGTVVASGTATHSTPPQYDFAIPSQAAVDALTLDWSGTIGVGVVTVRDIVEVVGGFLFGLGRAYSELKLSTLRPVPTGQTVADRRVRVEQEAESISGRTFVPRFARFLLDGSGTAELVVPDIDLRAVRAAKVAPRAGGTFVDLTADQLAAVAPEPWGVLVRDDGGVWPAGHRNVLVEYEHGWDMAPTDVRDMSIMRLRQVFSETKSTIPARAITWTAQDGGTYRLTNAGPRSTGSPEIDAAYLRHSPGRTWLAA